MISLEPLFHRGGQGPRDLSHLPGTTELVDSSRPGKTHQSFFALTCCCWEGRWYKSLGGQFGNAGLSF